MHVGVPWASLELNVYKNTKDLAFQKLEMVICNDFGEIFMIQVIHYLNNALKRLW